MIYESVNTTNPDTVRVNTIHLDSYKATQLTNSFSPLGLKSYFNVQFNLNNVYRNVRSVKLQSMELPVMFPNVRDNGLNELKMLVYGVEYTVLVIADIYTSIDALITKVNQALASHASGYTFSIASATSTQLAFTSNVPLISQWSIVNTPFSNLILGFYADDPHPVASTILSVNKWSLNVDNYLLLNISELGSNDNVSRATFKIPLPATAAQVLYLTENLFFNQTIYTNIPTLSTLSCKFTDRFGNELSSLGGAWSASLQIISS
jgi:hypothetical protein